MRMLGEDGARTFVACVADGAGSAKHSELGSSIVCNSMIENATKYFEMNGGFENLQFENVLEWCEDARTRILDAATLHDCRTREFATTLCVAIIGPDDVVFLPNRRRRHHFGERHAVRRSFLAAIGRIRELYQLSDV